LRLDGRTSRSYLAIASAIVIASVLVSAGIFAAMGGAKHSSSSSVSPPSTSTYSSQTSSSTSSESTATSTAVSKQVTSSSTDSEGLRIQVELNETDVPSNGLVLAEVSLYNPSSQNLTLSVADAGNSTLDDWIGFDFLCGDSSFGTILGYALFKGDYVASNFSLAPPPLQLAPEVPISCVGGGNPIGAVVFLPDSSMSVVNGGLAHPLTVNASTGYCVDIGTGGICGGGHGLIGYWSTSAIIENGTLTSPYFVHFQPGNQYTLAVMDAWGGALYAHFKVS
jgi:hypothetical protein